MKEKSCDLWEYSIGKGFIDTKESPYSVSPSPFMFRLLKILSLLSPLSVQQPNCPPTPLSPAFQCSCSLGRNCQISFCYSSKDAKHSLFLNIIRTKNWHKQQYARKTLILLSRIMAFFANLKVSLQKYANIIKRTTSIWPNHSLEVFLFPENSTAFTDKIYTTIFYA